MDGRLMSLACALVVAGCSESSSPAATPAYVTFGQWQARWDPAWCDLLARCDPAADAGPSGDAGIAHCISLLELSQAGVGGDRTMTCTSEQLDRCVLGMGSESCLTFDPTCISNDAGGACYTIPDVCGTCQ